MTKTRLNRKGFTLLELLIAIAIIGVLAALFINTFPNSQRRARDTQRRSDIKQYQSAMELYANNNNGTFLTYNSYISPTLCDSTHLNTTTCPDDPSGGSRHYYVYSNGSLYGIYAILELPTTAGSPNFIACSNGRTYESIYAPSSGTPCP
jgi:prepilin-type N-terminal cleavage/methylation domain-containing protein